VQLPGGGRGRHHATLLSAVAIATAAGLMAAGPGTAAEAASAAPASAAPVASAAPAPAPATTAPASLVNPLIGTGSASPSGDSGHTNPGPDTPFGMIQMGPDTSPTRENGGGYWYDSSHLFGFSLDRLSGAGCPVYGDVPILPMVGAIPLDPAHATASFTHASETARTGYYKVTTTAPAPGSATALPPGSATPPEPVTTQLTTATRSAIARFTFPASTQSDLLLKVAGSAQKLATVNGQAEPGYQKVFGTSARVVGNDEVTGSVTAGDFCDIKDDAHPNYTLHFDIKFNHRFTASGTWPAGPSGPSSPSGKSGASGKSGPSGKPGGVYLTFDTTRQQTVTAKVGISYTSGANAALNLRSEIPGWDFNGVRGASVKAWNQLLGRIQVHGGARRQQTEFYTALYHALLDPHVYSDVNGQYPGMDRKVHSAAPGHGQYADYSGWDIYRSQVQLLAMLAPDRASDIIGSMLNDYAQDGMLPKWAQGNGESYEMSGDPADAIIADAYAFGARGFDTEKALADMIAEATRRSNIRPGQALLDRYGYLPSDRPAAEFGCCAYGNAVSTQLEYDTADYAIAAFARELHDQSAYTRFASRAQSWQNVFNPGTGYAQQKLASGRWAPGFSPGTSAGFVEGTSAGYTPMVPFDLAAVIAARGGPRAWQHYLDGLLSDITSPGPANAQLSNEPSLIIPWEYDYAGAPWKTQQAVRAAQHDLYTDSPGGEPGNDDLGTFGAWLVWSELGLYPAVPGTGTLVIGSPVFPRAVIRLAGGGTITINGRGAAGNAPYVQRLTVNGRPWPKTYLTSGQYRRGATLTFDLGTAPNTSWGSAPDAAPPSDGTGAAPVLPYLPAQQVRVEPGHSATVTIKSRGITPRLVTILTTASAPAGITASVTPSVMRLAPAGLRRAAVTVRVAAGTAAGSYRVPVRMSAGGHGPSATAVLAVTVPRAG
jgi:putative alpha-1,2-mannosidase